MKNTAALKSFATAARTALIEQMRARVVQLLADAKVEAEYPRELTALRTAVAAHGAGWVAETAAYTWFNRLTAARYMDANGFSGLYGVVSPATGSASSLPEILARAQAGDFPTEVPEGVRVTVTDVLTGRRLSNDPDAEAYGLLLGAVFLAWHQPMPEVFPAAVDWIRLLTPVDILAPTSVRALAVAVMNAEACENVEVAGWLYQFYNAELKETVDASKVKIDASNVAPKTQLFTPHWIVRYLVENSLGRLWLRSRPSSGLRSQLDYYVEPVAGQDDTGVTVESPEEIRVLDPACGSGHMLTYAFDLLYAIYEEAGYTPSAIPALILTHNLRGLEIDARAAQLASFALAMKARGRDRGFFSRRGADRLPIQPDIVRVTPVVFDGIEVERITGAVAPEEREPLTRLLHTFTDADTFGSLIRVSPMAIDLLELVVSNLDEEPGLDIFAGYSVDAIRILLRQARALVDHQYHVVIANPPYLGSGNMGAKLSEFAKKQFSDSKADLCVMFIERNAELTLPAGSIAMVTKHQWMFIDSYKLFRAGLPMWGEVETLAHLGPHAFDAIDGEVVQAAAFVICDSRGGRKIGKYIRLVEGESESEKRTCLLAVVNLKQPELVYIRALSDFHSIPQTPLVYWLSAPLVHAFANGRPLAETIPTKSGMNTGDNDAFTRDWWEVSRALFRPGQGSEREFRKVGAVWCPYNKGGSTRRWYGNQTTVLRFDVGSAEKLSKQGNRLPSREWYFKPAVSWSKMGGSYFRNYPEGFIFDDAGPSAFAPADDRPGVLGFLNSSSARTLLSAVSPSFHFLPGQIARLPRRVIDQDISDSTVRVLLSLFKSDWNDYENSWDFESNPLVTMATGSLQAHAKTRWDDAIATTGRAQELEEANNRYFAQLYELESEVDCDVPLRRISLTQNPYFRYAPNKSVQRTDAEYRALFFRDLAKELVSYAVGVMMGRYSLDKPGLVLADAAATITDFDRSVPDAQFRPDADAIIPITAERYFEDDIVTRLREFLAIAFGATHVEANVSWLEHALGLGKRKNLRDYFLNDFYGDHVKTYSKRPIYWQVSSPKGGFSALFYLHRYTPATLGLIHQDYAEELLGKLKARLDTIEHALPSADRREATQLARERDMLTAQRREVRDWIDDALFLLASAEIPLDLDDGVKQNYPKLKGVVKKVTGL